MWVDTLRPHLGGVSLTRYALNFLAVLCAALFWTILFSQHAHAADASWQGGSLVYNDKSYQGPTKADRAAAQRLGIPENSQYFEYIDTTSDPKKSQIIYFSPGEDLKDASSAQLAEYTYDDRGTEDKYTKLGSPQNVSVKKDTYESGGTKEETSCAISGIGYVICPIMSFLADAMDKMYDILKRFLEVKPLSTDRESGLYKAWSIMLSIANVLFIIGFLVIIYSYVTNQGVKQYDLRNVIPRLIIAAILINVSYYICAIAVDASNIIGASLQDVFNNIRKDVMGNSVADPSAWMWANVTTYILSAGTIGAGVISLGVYGTAALHLLTPVLVTAGFAILVALVILAARQALITVLIVVAPLAFAAFILPSTQKYFDKWKDLFMTMLMVYPMFAMLFGGSQLAATLIAQNASSAIVILFAMFIQVVPLVITPFLIKFSGSLLGRLAGVVNNPAKGLGDRMKNASKDRLDAAKDRRLSEQNRGWKRTPGLAMTQKLDKSKRNRESKRKTHQAIRNAQYAAQSEQLHIDQKRAEARAAAAEQNNDAAYEVQKLTNASVKREAVQNQMAERRLHNQKSHFENYMHELESNKGAALHARNGDDVAAALGHDVHSLAQDHLVQESRKSFADSVHRQEIAKALDDSNLTGDALKAAQQLQAESAGIAGRDGVVKVKAKAMSDIINAEAEAVKAVTTASPVKAGDAMAAGKMLQEAIDNKDLTSMRAYTDMLASSANVGVAELRRVLTNNHSMLENFEGLDTFKHHINSNASLNASAEDIGTWSRKTDPKTSLRDVTNNPDTWGVLSAEAFSGMKKSSQWLALGYDFVETTGSDGKTEMVRTTTPVRAPGISKEVAESIVRSPATYAKLKDEIRAEIDKYTGTMRIPRS